jgi:hypothetical protein
VWETVWAFRETWREGGIYPERPIVYVEIGMILIGSKPMQGDSWTLFITFYRQG